MEHFFHLIHTHVWKSMIIVVALTNDERKKFELVIYKKRL
jgi:hypothetical protein